MVLVAGFTANELAIFITSLASRSNRSFLVELKSNLQIEVVNLNSEMRARARSRHVSESFIRR